MNRTARLVVLAAIAGCGNVDMDPPGDPDGAPRPDARPAADATVGAPDAGAGFGPWSTPVRLEALSTNDAGDSTPSVTDDRLQLFFTSDRGGSSQIYVSVRFAVGDPWGLPDQVVELNAPGPENGPDISPDGRTIWFSRSVGTP